MIVTFQPTINNTADYTACYINFLRCVTAIATAAAGTTTLTVNPYTASNTIDTTKNCIISIDANAEAGGWTTSASHNVPSSLSNTATTYTALASAAAYLYKADFYNTSGKSTYPYKKLCFHSYNDSSAYNHYSSSSSYSAPTRSYISAARATNMLITFGCSSTTDWTSTTFPPSGGVVTNQINDQPNAGQTTSYTLNQNTVQTSSLYNQGPGLTYNDTTIQYHMAITADYCVIWESKVGDTYTAGYFTTPTNGQSTAQASNWNYPRYGSIYYMGMRQTQPWEDTMTNNPPWVCWQYTGDLSATAGTTSPFSQSQVAAYMATVNNSGITSTSAKIYTTANSYNQNTFFGGSSIGRNTNEQAWDQVNYYTYSKKLDGPLFLTRAMSNNIFNGEAGYTTNMLYMPQYDTVTGGQVPGAYPIKISRCYTGDWNPGGACRGIYKSLSMPYATMKLYWQAANQTYTIGSDTYIPFVLNEDMWLVRFA